ncbi:hypothetical protein GOP47_0007630 [Adiantum capillus-veneris]|nr:hypothetical protein GOP47_0007630 [Adiantum capillus-veneris]
MHPTTIGTMHLTERHLYWGMIRERERQRAISIEDSHCRERDNAPSLGAATAVIVAAEIEIEDQCQSLAIRSGRSLDYKVMKLEANETRGKRQPSSNLRQPRRLDAFSNMSKSGKL